MLWAHAPGNAQLCGETAELLTWQGETATTSFAKGLLQFSS